MKQESTWLAQWADTEIILLSRLQSLEHLGEIQGI